VYDDEGKRGFVDMGNIFVWKYIDRKTLSAIISVVPIIL